MLPLRMNTVEVVVRKLSKDRTHWDRDFEEPITKKDRSEEVTLHGQVNLGRAGADRAGPWRSEAADGSSCDRRRPCGGSRTAAA